MVLTRQSSLLVPILYLPRSYTPSFHQLTPFRHKDGLLPEDNLKELHLVPKFLTRVPKDTSLLKTEVEAKVNKIYLVDFSR